MKPGKIIAVFVVASAIFGAACGKKQDVIKEHDGQKTAKAEKKALYHCPMHPTYTSNEPGECPICGMNLVPIEDDEGGVDKHAEHQVEGQSRVKVDSRRRQLIGLKTAAAAERHMVKVIRSVGRVAYDPELYRTQEEYLTALGSYRKISAGGSPEAAQRSKTLLESSKLRLKILGISEGQIEELAKRGKPEVSLLLAQGKGSTPWLYADVYESDLPVVRVGQAVKAVSSSLPGEVFEGRIKAIDPTINPKTRSVRIRVQLDDAKGLLRPDTYLNARIQVDMGKRLAIPAEAVVDTGVRQVVFVDEGEGYITPRIAVLGVRDDEFVEVREGIAEGEAVVTSGNFLIDSESKLKAAIAAIAGGHQH
ncbi:MAG: efflux RND transporter periplasmic adaptor subunit [Elusimicrobiota bacterium]